MSRINLDHNASAPLLPEVAAATAAFLDGARGNPSSVHWYGRRARTALEDARARVAALLGGRPREVLLTGGATEANNHALRGVVEAAGPGAHVVVSAVEHSSVRATAEYLARRGHPLTVLPVQADGRLDPDRLRAALRPSTAIVSIQAANHETGVLQRLPELARITREAGVPLHTDAAQAVGRVPLDVASLGVDLLTLSGHKIGGPVGIGALWIRDGIRVEPLLHGGGQESGRRSGTENVPAAVGLAAAAGIAARTPGDFSGRVGPLRDSLEQGLRRLWPGARVHGGEAPRLANTASVGFPALDGETAVMRLDLEGIGVSLGSACDAGSMRPSDVLEAMGVGEDLARASVRFSLGLDHREADVRSCLRIFEQCIVPGAVTAAAQGAEER